MHTVMDWNDNQIGMPTADEVVRIAKTLAKVNESSRNERTAIWWKHFPNHDNGR